MMRDVYSGRLKLHGEEHGDNPNSSQQLRDGPIHLKRFKEAKSLLRKTMPVARRVVGESNDSRSGCSGITPGALSERRATLDDLREAVNTLKDVATDRAARARRRAPATSNVEQSCETRENARHQRSGAPTAARPRRGRA